jgi:hypothetical protein
LANGLDYSTGKLLVEAFDEQDFGKLIAQSLLKNSEEIAIGATAKSFREEIESTIVDIADAQVAGWTFLVSDKDPHRKEIIDIIKPLAQLRRMEKPDEPLAIGNETEDDWPEWLDEKYHSPILEGKRPPYYVLIIGSPALIPFRFQSLLDSAAAVGRLDFDSLPDLQTYVEKIIRLQVQEEPQLRKETVMFATDDGPLDPTYYSCKYMARPIADHMTNLLGYKTTTLLQGSATKQNMVSTFKETHPALVYTASHGLGAPDLELGEQKKINGAICCQATVGQPSSASVFSAADVPNDDENFLEGSVFIQFACYGYGTPSESYYSHWLPAGDVARLNAKSDFVAALPKRLLAHPKGPIAFVGHLDLAWLHAFNDPADPDISLKWHPRITPFVHIVNTLLKDLNTVGLGMETMNKRYDITNSVLTTALDKIRKKRVPATSEFFSKIAEIFITRSDAQNYMVFGDPAVQLRVKR